MNSDLLAKLAPLALDTATRLVAAVPEIGTTGPERRAVVEQLTADLHSLAVRARAEPDRAAFFAALIESKGAELELALEESRLAAEWESIEEHKAWARGAGAVLLGAAKAGAPLLLAAL
ncbi:MAG TPA: hypothetical protein VEA41_21265 [Salinarimonas sp.]|nr:hypothetical protein [Salinarimonas sp.]